MKLLDQLRREIRVRHYSIRTEQAYVDWCRRYIVFHNKRHPREMGAAEINQFLSHLATDANVAASTQNQALCGILFLYRHVLKMDPGDLGEVIWAKRPKRLPTILTATEVHSIMSHLFGLHRLMVETLYGTGMRILELFRLRVKDVDFERRLITVRDAKGKKDRVVGLPDRVADRLSDQIKKTRQTHQKGLADGYGRVYLPYALEKKYPNANKEWCWQYVFPARNLSVDPRSGR